MTDDELHRHAEELAQQFESRGFIVTRRLEVEAAGLAAHLGISEKTLRNWRAEEFGPPSSRTVRRVAHAPRRMFDLVADVERYPQFVPLCTGLEVRSRRQEGDTEIVTAAMQVAYAMFRESYTSRIVLDPASDLLDLVDAVDADDGGRARGQGDDGSR